MTWKRPCAFVGSSVAGGALTMALIRMGGVLALALFFAAALALLVGITALDAWVPGWRPWR